MALNLVSSSVVIAKAIDMFNIKGSEFITRAPVWISELLAKTNNYCALEKTYTDVTVTEGRGRFPCDAKLLIMMEYNRCRLPRLNGVRRNTIPTGGVTGPVMTGLVYINTKEYDDSGNLISSSTDYDNRMLNTDDATGHWYSPLNNNYFETSFDSDTVRVHYKRYPIDEDGLPYIPDDENIKMASAFYILYMMLSRGYKHPVYQIGHSKDELNPYKMWGMYSDKARNTISQLDDDQRELYHQLFITMVPSFTRWSEELI